MMDNLIGKNILITGGSRGLGLETAKKLALLGANVAICARDDKQLLVAKQTLENIADVSESEQKISSYCCDIASGSQWLISSFLEDYKTIDVLINNAGIHGAIGKLEDVDWTKWVEAIIVNLISSAFLCKSVIPFMRTNGGGRIIQISGGGATSPIANMTAYASSKAGIVRFVECLAEEVRDDNIFVNAVAPGILPTRMIAEVLENKEKVSKSHYEQIRMACESGKLFFDDATDLIAFLSSNDSDGITGKLISAKYDNWRDFVSHKEEIASSDVFTLRRIIGKDRGLKI